MKIPPYAASLQDWMRQVSTAFNALEAKAPVNLAPNSQWEVMSGLTYGTRWNALGTGTYSTAAMTSNSTGSNLVVLTASGGIPSEWAVGELVKLSGGTAHSTLTQRPMRILAKDATTITVKCPFNGAPSSSGTATITPVNIGGAASSGTGDAADGWKKHTSTYVWRDDYATNRPFGATYSLAAIKNTAGQEYVYTQLDVTRLKGRTVCFGINVMQRVRSGSGTWQLYFNTDGTGGGVKTAQTANAAVGVFKWDEYSIEIPSDATYAHAGVYLNGASGDAYYLANPVVAVGSEIGDNNYVKPLEQFIPLVKIEPWINASITFPSSGAISGLGYYFPVDFYADSGGQIAKSVRVLHGNIEGINTNAVVTGTGGSRIIGWADKSADPIKLGTFLPQHVANVKSFGALRVMLDGDGNCICLSPVASDSWSNISTDIEILHLE